MSASFYDLLKYAKTGIASSDMTAYDKMRALSLAGGKVKTLTGVPPLSFTGNGKPLISWSMKGNGQQTGTPAPDAPIMPQFVGVNDGGNWKIPITCAGQTVPIYLGQVQTLRKIQKIEFDGSENWIRQSVNDYGIANFQIAIPGRLLGTTETMLSSHFARQTTSIGVTQDMGFYIGGGAGKLLYLRCDSSIGTEIADFQRWLAAQKTNGTPVSFWYILETPQTAIVNESLAKIGTYADTLDSTDAGVTIQTVRGRNTLTVDTELQPASMTITYCG